MIQAIRGMNDILPEEIPYWYLIENACRHIVKQYGYQEIRFPIVEDTTLFKRTIGEDTDIVEKEMYTFEDRNGDSLTLRPEGTAGCVRACIEHRLLYKQTQRLWYLGPMFRHERPQKGRYRQFYQLGIEAYGMPGPEIDAEIIFMGARLWRELGLNQHIELQLNSLGTREARARYREALLGFLKPHFDELDPDSQRRLSTNPLRILDSKNPHTQNVIAKAPKMLDFLDSASQSRWDRLRTLLDEAHLSYVINPNLVRGLDYYGETVFEWVTNALGAQGTVCAGGRYDSLLEQLGEREPTPAIGFAAGIERLVLLLRSIRTCTEAPDLYLVLLGSVAEAYGLKAIERLREALPYFSVETNLNGGSMKSQLKRADKRGVRWAAIIGEEEVKSDKISLKNLRDESPQQTLGLTELIAYLKEKTND